MVDAGKEPFRPRHRVAQILIRPEHLAFVQRNRIEEVEIDPVDMAMPSGCGPRQQRR